jgi:hypothetical protein
VGRLPAFTITSNDWTGIRQGVQESFRPLPRSFLRMRSLHEFFEGEGRYARKVAKRWDTMSIVFDEGAGLVGEGIVDSFDEDVLADELV